MLNVLVAWWGRNPVAGNLLMLACAIAGALSFARMEKEFFPPGRDNSVRVEAVWPGASPEDMESQVTVRVEEALADLDGVNWVRSRSMEGFAWVNVIANPGVDMAALTAEVRSRVDAVSGLPAGIEPPTVSQNIGRNFSIILGIHGKVDERTLRQTAERIRDEIALLPGATNIQVTGARRPEVSIEVSEEKLRQFGLRFDDVANAIRASSINLSSGSVRTADGDYHLRARNLADSEVEFGKIVVRQTPDGGAIRLSDVAAIIDGYQDVNVFSKLNGEPSVTLFVLTADKFNILETSKAVDEYLKTKASQLPTGVSISKMYDERDDFSALMDILIQNAIQGFALIFILLLLTLHPKVAIWATFGVMTAFAGSFFILPYVDVSLNFMTVFGFLLVLGIMVDDAIIVGEAVYERVEQGYHGVDAAIMATQLVLKPLVASVLVTMIAFSPMMFLSGEVQQFTRAISIVVMSTLFFSLIESLIILPGHLGHVKPLVPGPTMLGRLAGLQVASANSVVWFARTFYGPMMRTCVRWRYVTLAVFVVVFMAAIALVGSNRIKQTFMPDVEGDFMQASIELPRTTPFSRMEEVAAQLDAARLALEKETMAYAIKDPFTGKMSNGVVRSWSTAIEENSVRAYVTLTPPESRDDLRSKAITERMKKLLGDVPDADRVSFELNGGGNGPSIQIAILGADQAELRSAVDALKAKLLSFAAVTSVRDSEEAAIEELRFTMKPGAEQLGVTLSDRPRSPPAHALDPGRGRGARRSPRADHARARNQRFLQGA
ncbi:MAG: efflux RND transporter permease subunit [Alphaproteobacteria bacterium]|nr:efflux RND transporter permease subunit [Alphaproteobacteria bacterium]